MTMAMEHCDDTVWNIVMSRILEHCDDTFMEHCDEKNSGAL